MKFDTEKLSGVLAWVGLLGSFLSSAAMVLEIWSPKHAATALVVSAAISAFTKRVHRAGRKRKTGGKAVSTILLLSLAVSLTACGPQTIAKAKEQSRQLAKYTNAGVDVTRELFKAKIITLEQKDRIADAFLKLARAGQTFDKTIAKIEQEYGKNIPASKIEQLFKIFDGEIVSEYLNLLKDLGVAVQKVREIITLLKTVVLTAAGLFDKRAAIEARLEGV